MDEQHGDDLLFAVCLAQLLANKGNVKLLCFLCQLNLLGRELCDGKLDNLRLGKAADATALIQQPDSFLVKQKVLLQSGHKRTLRQCS